MVLSCEKTIFTDPAEIARRLAIPFRKEERPISLRHDFQRRIALPTIVGMVNYKLVATGQHLGSTGW